MATSLIRQVFRRGSVSEWTAADPVPLDGEPIFERDAARLRIGNGTGKYSALRAFLSVPKDAIALAQGFLNATTALEQRNAIGITASIATLNSFGPVAPQTVTDWHEVHALGSGTYRATGAAANSPTTHLHVGHYERYDGANGAIMAMTIGSAGVMRVWAKRLVANTWEPWEPIGGKPETIADWNTAVRKGHYWAGAGAANRPFDAFCRGFVVENGDGSGITQVLWAGLLNRMAFRNATIAAGVPTFDAWVEAITTANFASYTGLALPPFTSGWNTLTNGQPKAIAHPLGVLPKIITGEARAKVANNGFAVGDIIDIALNSVDPAGSVEGICAVKGTANVTLLCAPNGPGFCLHKTTMAGFQILNSEWEIRINAFA